MKPLLNNADKEKISFLFSGTDDEIWRIIHEAIHNGTSEKPFSVNYVEKLINSYISISDLIGEKLPYGNMKEFFCYYSPEGITEYNSFVGSRNITDDCVFKEKDIEFLLKHKEGEICRLITEVLNNDPNDPHYSAVYAVNQIKCFIDVSNQLGRALTFDDVSGFFITHGFLQKQYSNFEISRKDESKTYRGPQY
ncbi:MAG: hypothetical protein ACI4IX_02905 [Acutalibacteraceae bacterium]